MGPLDSIICWQALLVALTASGFAQLTKTVIDITWGMRHETPTPTLADAMKLGGALRAESLIINRLILPAAPIFGGFLFALLIPLHPENLSHYVESHEIVGWQARLIFGAWGAVCGQFADYAVSKVKDFLGTQRTIRATSAPPPAADPPGPPSDR